MKYVTFCLRIACVLQPFSYILYTIYIDTEIMLSNIFGYIRTNINVKSSFIYYMYIYRFFK